MFFKLQVALRISLSSLVLSFVLCTFFRPTICSGLFVRRFVFQINYFCWILIHKSSGPLCYLFLYSLSRNKSAWNFQLNNIACLKIKSNIFAFQMNESFFIKKSKRIVCPLDFMFKIWEILSLRQTLLAVVSWNELVLKDVSSVKHCIFQL